MFIKYLIRLINKLRFMLDSMKAVIMAAGKGRRMLPLTLDIPKVLVEICGKPFLYYLLKNLEKAGVEDIAIIAGYKKEMIEEFVSRYGFRIGLIEQKEQKGTGHAVKLAREFADGKNFLVLNGDNLWSADDINSICNDNSFNYVCGIEHKHPEKYGVLDAGDGFLRSIVEKPVQYVGSLINTGLYKFTPEIFDALDKIGISLRGEYELTDAIAILAKQKKVKVKKINDYWKDLGKIEDIELIENFIKTNKGEKTCAE